jgi:hypothetical protein
MSLPSPDASPLREATDPFVQTSAVLTGFSAVELWGTGMVASYRQVLQEAASAPIADRLVATGEAIFRRTPHNPAAVDEAFRHEILADATLGPVARGLIQLWYLGAWTQLPAIWRRDHGANPGDQSRVISAQSYPNALVYLAADTHPPGARQPGYGSWALPATSVQARRPGEEQP